MTETGVVCALLPAAGRGVRFGQAENKVFAPLLGRPLLGWTLEPFVQCDRVNYILLIGSEDDLPRLREIADEFGGGKVRDVILGGATRQESVYNGLLACPDAQFILVHDAARPCVSPVHVMASTFWIRKFDSLTWAIPVNDTLVRGEKDPPFTAPNGMIFEPDVKFLKESVSRDGLFAVQTPQAFYRDMLLEAHESARRDGFQGTDDAGLIRRLGKEVMIAEGSPENLKVTRWEDLKLAEAILRGRQEKASKPALTPSPSPNAGRGESHGSTPASEPVPPTDNSDSPLYQNWERGAGGVRAGNPPTFPFRIGHGYDVHEFADGRKLFLGGVEFPEAPRGLLGHSDADALLHAVCDALLGAAGLGDIGKLFPPSDNRHKDRPSIEFLLEVKERLDTEGWSVGNVDITVLAETPKIGPRAGDIRAKIAVSLDIDAAQVSVKATTNEGMGFVGRGEGIAVHATALLYRTFSSQHP